MNSYSAISYRWQIGAKIEEDIRSENWRWEQLSYYEGVFQLAIWQYEKVINSLVFEGLHMHDRTCACTCAHKN